MGRSSVTPVNVTISAFNGSDVGTLVSTDTKASKVYAPDGRLVQEIAAAKGNIVVQLMRDANELARVGDQGVLDEAPSRARNTSSVDVGAANCRNF